MVLLPPCGQTFHNHAEEELSAQGRDDNQPRNMKALLSVLHYFLNCFGPYHLDSGG